MKYLKSRMLVLLLAILHTGLASAYQMGDTITLGAKKYRLLSDNLVTNPGFENGFAGWTDGTTAAATLTSEKFNIVTTGGVANSSYLVGLTNESSAGSGSIGTGWAIQSGKTYLFAYQVKYQSATAAAATETYLKVSLTNVKTSTAEPKILISGTSVSSGGAWTQNSILFTNTSPVYAYLAVRFRWLNNRLGFDDFLLCEAVEVANIEALQTSVNQAVALYKADTPGAEAFLAAITSAQSYLTGATTAQVETATTSLNKAILTYRYANASEANPLDMTSWLVNPGFDDNTATGWTGTGTINYHEVEYYEKTFNLNQAVSGLPAGKYRLRAQGFERPKANDGGAAYKAGTETIYAKLYATATNYSQVSTPFNSIYKHAFTGTGSQLGYVNTMAAAETMMTNAAGYFEMTLDDILLDEGGSLTLGARSDFKQTGYWTLCDHFRLEYVGAYDAEDLRKAVLNRSAEALALSTQHVQATAATGLTTAIAAAASVTEVQPPVMADLKLAKDSLDKAIQVANTSLTAYGNLQKALTLAARILGFLDKADEITKLQAAIVLAQSKYDDTALTLTQINAATASLKTTTQSVGKKIYVPTWMMGDVYTTTNNWSIERSRQSKNWILFWEPGFGDDPGSIVDDCLTLAEKAYAFYADSLQFIKRGSSKTDTYKMIIRLRYTTEWEATGSGVDNTIGLLTLTTWALTSRSGQTVAHEVGHCFQYQVHCDNNDNNGWMYGYGANATGSNGWWEQCAQWQAYKVFPTMQFSNEWFSGYMTTANKHLLHETPRYNNFFIQDYWTYLHGMGEIGLLWNKSYNPEDPIETYKRLHSLTQTQFNDEMWDCAARFATWDIPAIKAAGAGTIASRPQPKMNNQGSYVWRIDSTVCVENYGHNIVRLNAPTTAKTLAVYFTGLAGSNGFRKNYTANAGWRYGLVALLSNGTRLYSPAKTVAMGSNGGKDTLLFDCPSNCSRLMLVVTGAPTLHWRHAWDDNDANDEQWPYQVTFGNTNLYGYTNIISSLDAPVGEDFEAWSEGGRLHLARLTAGSTVHIVDLSGRTVLNERVTETSLEVPMASGLYLVRVSVGNVTRSRKIVMK